MDISVFCNYLDQICIMLSVSDRLNRHYYLNDIMLPRNWLLWVVQQPHQPEIQEGYLNILKKFLIHLSHVLVYLGREDDGPPQQGTVTVHNVRADSDAFKNGYTSQESPSRSTRSRPSTCLWHAFAGA
jgi:hypothetical protein